MTRTILFTLNLFICSACWGVMAEGREGIAAFSTERESLVLSGAAVESVISMTCEGGLGAVGGEDNEYC